jgi:hypothetical protein
MHLFAGADSNGRHWAIIATPIPLILPMQDHTPRGRRYVAEAVMRGRRE